MAVQTGSGAQDTQPGNLARREQLEYPAEETSPVYSASRKSDEA